MRWFFEVVPRPLASGSQNLVTFGIRCVTGSTDWWLNSPGASFLAINGDRYWCNNQLKIYCFRRGYGQGLAMVLVTETGAAITSDHALRKL